MLQLYDKGTTVWVRVGDKKPSHIKSIPLLVYYYLEYLKPLYASVVKILNELNKNDLLVFVQISQGSSELAQRCLNTASLCNGFPISINIIYFTGILMSLSIPGSRTRLPIYGLSATHIPTGPLLAPTTFGLQQKGVFHLIIHTPRVYE